MPRKVVKRAKTLLSRLERHAAAYPTAQLNLFARPAPPEEEPEESGDRLREALSELDPDAMSPRDALEALYRLRELAEE